VVHFAVDNYFVNDLLLHLLVWWCCAYLCGTKAKDMKHVIFYKATSGYWFAQFPIKGECKPRRMACGTTDQDLQNAIERYTKKGYSYTIN
jgi:hypothetical protein